MPIAQNLIKVFVKKKIVYVTQDSMPIAVEIVWVRNKTEDSSFPCAEQG